MTDPTDDAELVRRVASEMRDHYAYTGALGWLRHGKRGVWKPINDRQMLHVVMRRLEEIAAELAQDDALPRPSPRSVKLLRQTRKAESVMRPLAGALTVELGDFDQNPADLNCPNGVVDLRTGELRQHQPSDRFLLCASAPFEPGATSPAWAAATAAMTEQTLQWMQLRLGQAITGETPPDDRILFLQGGGENGKSLFVTGLQTALGDYAKALPHRVLLASPGDHPTELMELRGLRLGILEELPEGRYLNVQRLKATVGTSRISARLIRRDSVQFDATHALIVTTNYMPQIAETDAGTWRRLVMIPFPFRYVSVPTAGTNERPRDDTLKTALQIRDPAVLAWLIEGAVRYYNDPEAFREVPEEVRLATASWRDDADLIGQFFEEEIELDEGNFVASARLAERFNKWLEPQGHQRMNVRTFMSRWRSTESIASLMAAGVIAEAQGQGLDGRKAKGVRGIRLREMTYDHEYE
ncbi:DNA primase family protein [Demequina phytophila]|uniref:DNA primase family protein n=1 Tax=Demequina phytophila TaxID=1638981 RepID=UPI000780C75A|nr:phage/plasmid primase, P4 family [Demequina phytophila]